MISDELRVLDDKLHKVSDNITAAYNKITEKGGTPTGTTSLELAESIDTIPEGGGGEFEDIWLTNENNTYVNLNINPNEYDSLYISYKVMGETTKICRFFGAASSSSDVVVANIQQNSSYPDGIATAFYNQRGRITKGAIPPNTKSVLYYSQYPSAYDINSFTYGFYTPAKQSAAANATVTQPVYLFAHNNQGTADIMLSGMIYISDVKMWKDGSLIRDFRASKINNVYCFKDLVNNRVYMPIGAGGLIRQDEDLLPSGYTRLQYVSAADGATQRYVDTNIFINDNNYSIVGKGAFQDPITSYSGFFSQYTSETAKTTRIIRNGTATNQLLAYYNSIAGQDSTIITTTLTSPIEYTVQSGLAIINNRSTTLKVSTNTSFGTTSVKVDCRALTYYFKILHNNIPVIDLIPCTDPQGTVGFYDLVSQTFLTSYQGELVAGPRYGLVAKTARKQTTQEFKFDIEGA